MRLAGVGIEYVQRGRGLRPQVNLVGQRALNKEIDLVVADVGIDGHQEVTRRRGRQAAVPIRGRQRRRRVGVAQVDRHMAVVSRGGHIARQLRQVDAAELRLDLAPDGRGEAAEERLAIEHPLAHLLPFLDVARPAQHLQQVVGVDDLLRVGDGHGADGLDQQAQELLVDGDRSVERLRVQAIGVEVHRLARRGGEVGPEVGVAEDEDLQPHEVVERLGREVIGFGGDIIHVAGVAEAKIGDAAIFDCHHACAGEEAARGAQLVLVLGHDEIAPRPVRAQQRRQIGREVKAALAQRQPLVGQGEELPHAPRQLLGRHGRS